MSQAIAATTPSRARPATSEAVLKKKTWVLPVWINAPVLAVVWVWLVLYGTLVPFDFQVDASVRENSTRIGWLLQSLTAPRWQAYESSSLSSLGLPHWLSDVVVNVALFLPLGALLRLDAARKVSRWWLQTAYALIIVSTLSWLIECGQGLMPSRVASLNDVCLNTAGGLFGALIALRACRWGRLAIFKAYCRASYLLYHTKEFLIRQRRRPVMMFLVVAVNVLVVSYWYAGAVASAGDGKGIVNWLPFAEQFKRSYDVAAVQIGRSLIIYCLFSMVLSLQFMRASHRKGLWWIVIAVAVLAVAREVLEMKVAGVGADITEPIIGIMAVGFIITTACLLVHAVRCSCRRKKQVPVAVDRRRVPFKYEE